MKRAAILSAVVLLTCAAAASAQGTGADLTVESDMPIGPPASAPAGSLPPQGGRDH